MQPILFLDIDGVLIAYSKVDYSRPNFTPKCVEAFKAIVNAVPDVCIVLSSTWRLPQHINRLHELWVDHGLSESLIIDATPDSRNDPTISPLHRRGLEIKAWLDTNPNTIQWVVLDDDRYSIEPVLGTDRCVYTNSARGLNSDDAQNAIGILNRATKSPS